MIDRKHEEVYRVVVTGYLPDKGEHYIEIDFAELFKISLDRAKEILKATPYTVKENLNKPEAERYVNAMRKVGVDSEAQNSRFDLSGLSLEEL